MAEVRLDQISRRYGEQQVLAALDLTITDGEFFTIVGPSGCGKSTLLNILAGLERPSTGRIYFDGEDVTDQEPRERDVALVFQSYALYPHMRVRENLSFPLRVTKRTSGLGRQDIEKEVRRVAEMLGLEPLLDRWPRELSGGQRQRVALGRALIRQPRVFLMDEPLSNLDAQLRAVMRAELRRLHDRLGTTMIYVTHDQTEAMTLADRVAVLDRGHFQQVGVPSELYDRPGTLFVAGFIGYPQMNVLDAEVEGNRLRCGALDIPLGSPAIACRVHDGTRVKLGIRPEHLNIISQVDAGTCPEGQGKRLDGVLRLLEHTGGQLWASIEIGSAEEPTMLVGCASTGFSAKPGQPVAALLREGPIHLFDQDTGKTLGTVLPFAQQRQT